MNEFIYPEIEIVELEVEDIMMEILPKDIEGGLGWG